MLKRIALFCFLLLSGCGLAGVVPVLSIFSVHERDSSGESDPIPPAITHVAPVSGLAGTSVSLYGDRFHPEAVVYFGSVPADTVVVESNLEITVMVPASVSGPCDLTVSNPDGESRTLRNAFYAGLWWDSRWTRRRSVTVQGTPAGLLEDVQVKLNVVFDDDMHPDFSDLRFTQPNGSEETPVDFWTETSVASTYATFWLKMPSIPPAPGSTTVHAYYGNPDASSASDFEGTFTKNHSGQGVAAVYHMDYPQGLGVLDSSPCNNSGLMRNFASPCGWTASDGGQWGAREDVRFSDGHALRFDGADDYVDLGNPALDFSEGLAVEAWVKAEEASVCGREQAILAKWGSKPDFASGWSAFDPGSSGIGTDPDGYWGAAFDGRYVYFAPHFNGTGFHGEILRYNTGAAFDSINAWTSFRPASFGIGSHACGFAGAGFDGRYVYFVPHEDASGKHGEVLRLDTTGPFDAPGSWTAFNPGLSGVGDNAAGFAGCVHNGEALFFVPMQDAAPHGEVLRFSAASTFHQASSWSAFDPGAQGVGSDPDGYLGCLHDGARLLFAPYDNGAGLHGEFLAFDTRAGFREAASWSAYDPGLEGVGSTPDGFAGGAFDGDAAYFAPAAQGEILRLGTSGAFAESASWTAFDPSGNGIGSHAKGFRGALFDGRYVYFIPWNDGTAPHGEFLRYDSRADFGTASSWTAYDPSANGVGSAPEGYLGGVFDGRNFYFTPGENASGWHGEFLKYDALGSAASFKLCWSVPGQSGAFSGAPFGITGFINTDAGIFSVSSNSDVSPNIWHHVALSYDGGRIRLYVDGVQAGSSLANGQVLVSEATMTLGSVFGGKAFFRGEMDEVRLYGRALGHGEALAHYERRIFASPEPYVSVPGPEESWNR